MTNEQVVPSAWKPWHKKTLAGIGGVFVLMIGIATCAPDPDPETPAADASAPSSTAPESSAPEEVPEPIHAEAPTIISMPLNMAYDKLDIDAVDIGQHLFDDVNHERSVWDRANWRIAAQCTQTVDGKLRVGVIKSEESAAISEARAGAPIANNEYKFLLNCP